jgi:hypothetical protein
MLAGMPPSQRAPRERPCLALRLAPSAVAALLALSPYALACSDDAPEVDAPRVGTAFVFFGVAGAGRPFALEDVRVVPASELPTIELPEGGPLEVEVVFGGLDEANLPAGLPPGAIEFVLKSDPRAHRLPPLTRPHVLRAAAAPGAPLDLVPVEAEDAVEDTRAERRARLAALTAELRVADPCAVPTFDVSTPRTQASQIVTATTLSSGETLLGLATTSTALVGVLERAARPTISELPIDVGDVPIAAGEAAATVAFGGDEVVDGRPWPRYVALFRGSFLGGLLAYTATTGGYRDLGVAALDPQPARIRGVERVDVDGTDSVCFYGSTTGSGAIGSGARRAGLWCRAWRGGAWQVVAAIDEARTFTALIARPGAPLRLLDAAGTVHVRAGGRWRPEAVNELNRGCAPTPCIALDRAIALPSGPTLALMVGDDGNVWQVTEVSGGTEVTRHAPATAALFGDERAGDDAADLAVVSRRAGGGALIAGTRGPVLRLGRDLTAVERLCAPRGLVNPLTFAAELDDGALLLATSPISIAIAPR